MTEQIKKGTIRLKRAVSALTGSFDMLGGGRITLANFVHPPSISQGITSAFQQTGNHLKKALDRAKQQEQEKKQV